VSSDRASIGTTLLGDTFDRAKNEKRDLIRAEAKEVDRKTKRVLPGECNPRRRRYADPSYAQPGGVLRARPR